MMRSSLFLFAASLLAFHHEATLAADLVLTGYRVTEISRDESPYTGDDGVLIHGDDHYHDPCTSYQTGYTYTTGKAQGEANGFVVVNDCQITTCRKWTTPSGSSGGATVVYEIEPSWSAEPSVWEILESSPCDGCGGSGNCYAGKFAILDDYRDALVTSGCELGGSPGSIACDAERGDPVVVGQINEVSLRDDPKKSGLIYGGAAAAFLLAMTWCYCCCCRRNKKNKDEDKQLQQSQKVSSRSASYSSRSASSSTSNKQGGGGWFGRGEAKSAKNTKKSTSDKQVAAARSVPAGDQETSSKAKTGSFFSRNKTAVKSTAAVATVATVAAVAGSTKNTESTPAKKKNWMFGKKNSGEEAGSVGTDEDSRAGEEPQKQKKAGFFGKKSEVADACGDGDVEAATNAVSKKAEAVEDPEKKKVGLFGRKSTSDDSTKEPETTKRTGLFGKKSTSDDSTTKVASGNAKSAEKPEKTKPSGWFGKKRSGEDSSSVGSEKAKSGWFGKKSTSDTGPSELAKEVSKVEPEIDSEQQEVKRSMFSKAIQTDDEEAAATAAAKEASKKEAAAKKTEAEAKKKAAVNKETSMQADNAQTLDCSCCAFGV